MSAPVGPGGCCYCGGELGPNPRPTSDGRFFCGSHSCSDADQRARRRVADAARDARRRLRGLTPQRRRT